jgi:hypothetical protein
VRTFAGASETVIDPRAAQRTAWDGVR